jgi:long-chain acyl-CoA synthetase
MYKMVGVAELRLSEWYKERWASYKVPMYMEFRGMLPKSKPEKMLRCEMREGERRKIFE